MFPSTYRVVVYFGHNIKLEFLATRLEKDKFEVAMEKGRATSQGFNVVFNKTHKNIVNINPDFVQMYHVYQADIELLEGTQKTDITSKGLSFISLG